MSANRALVLARLQVEKEFDFLGTDGEQMNTMDKHTPGPWDWFTGWTDDDAKMKQSGFHARFLYGSNGQGFAHTVGLLADGVDEANANLMAAAPEMLNLIREYLADYTLSSEWQRKFDALLAKVDGTAQDVNRGKA